MRLFVLHHLLISENTMLSSYYLLFILSNNECCGVISIEVDSPFDIQSGKSSTKIENSFGPKRDPCGTP